LGGSLRFSLATLSAVGKEALDDDGPKATIIASEMLRKKVRGFIPPNIRIAMEYTTT